jgi:hypothetical protein
LLAAAHRVDAAVAFVTRPGVALLREYLKTHARRSGRLIASVRFPTDLPALANLEDEFPGTVRLHLGFKKPEEAAAERGQFHSKVLLLEMDATSRCIVVGSAQRRRCGQECHANIVGRFAACGFDSAVGPVERRQSLFPTTLSANHA